jgi:hypothetical protein
MKKLFLVCNLIVAVSFAKAQDCKFRLDFSALDVGAMHNNILLKLMNAKSQFERDNIVLSQNVDFSELKMTSKEFLKKAKDLNSQLETYDTNYNRIPSTILPDNLKPFSGRILSAINSYTTIPEFNFLLDNIQNDANAILKCDELDAMLVGINVARSAAYFWSPKEIGGSGIGDQFKPKNVTAKVECCKWFTTMLFGDYMGAATAVTGLGIGAIIGGALTPGTNVAILGGIGISAAIGSVTALIPSP